MKRPLAALLLAALALLGTAGCSDSPPDTTGDSNTERENDQVPAPIPSQ